MTQTEVYKIQERYLKDRLDIETVIEQLEDCIGKTPQPHYKPGKKLNLRTTDGKMYKLRHTGLKNKDLARTELLIAHLYLRAKESGLARPGELHMGKGRSSKHYLDGLVHYAS